MRKPVKVYLFGSENNGWALDTDLALTRESLLKIPETVELTSLAEAEVVHSVWEEPLFSIDQEALAGKRIVCHVCNDLMRLHENPVMIRAADTVGLWVGMSCRRSDLNTTALLVMKSFPIQSIPRYSARFRKIMKVQESARQVWGA